MLSALMEILAGCPTEDVDSLFRALVATGTLAHLDKTMAGLAKDLGVQVGGRAGQGSLYWLGTEAS